ncbi:alpha/beta fold hydrolase [Auritidibacter ignavus]|uniref:Alpha/beta hydrolase n=1 Tax=Auritidibacter ignavus TaxID=678932 RepID=A0AAJ6AI07_9MICC|nr:alpha/beta hydrolase [Auritidibacter ignavus]WGH84488.1 alpha/beta hydrolase [Auritidibacter ignavus]WGH93813.1 alpha/beta hydrolase [Auritidibacter ignavus]
MFTNSPTRIRFRDQLCPPTPVRDTATFTGFPMRFPERRLLWLADPVSGEPTPTVLYHYRPATGPTQTSTTQTSTAHRPDPVVMVHGFRGDHHGLQLVADALADHEIYIPDLPGFGASPALPTAPHRSEDFAALINQLPEALGLSTSPWLVGHSFGSIVASYAAATATSRSSSWRRLALLNPIARPALATDGSWFERVGTAVTAGFYRACASLPSGLGRWALSATPMVWATGAVMSETDDRRILAYTHDQHQQYFSEFDTPHSLLQAYQASISTTVAEAAPDITVPVLLIAGGKDPLASVDDQRVLATRFGPSSHVRLEVIAETGHLMHYEQAPAIGRLLTDWMSEVA